MKYFEVIFDIAYLLIIFYIGISLLKIDKKIYRLFGVAACILGGGDIFHLAPRVYNLVVVGSIENTAIVGVGKVITSITATIFYILLIVIYKIRYKKDIKKITEWLIKGLVVIRMVLLLLPQNNWLSGHDTVEMAVIRNIPFFVIGFLVAYLYYFEGKRMNDFTGRMIGIYIVISFMCYMPIIFWVNQIPMLGMLMIPKTIVYVLSVQSIYKEAKKVA